jgi:hypothetical protein
MVLVASGDSIDVRIAQIKADLSREWAAIRLNHERIGELLWELHEILAARGREGQFSAFLREIDFPRSTAYEWMQKHQLKRQSAEFAKADKNIQPQADQQDVDTAQVPETGASDNAKPMLNTAKYTKKVAIKLSVGEAESMRDMLEDAAFQTFLGTDNWHATAFRAVKWAFDRSRALDVDASSEKEGGVDDLRAA